MKEIRSRFAAALVLAAAPLFPVILAAQTESAPAGPPPSAAIFPLSEVHKGLHAIAWTVFTGNKPEPMQVEILGVLYGGRGPGHDMILAQLKGSKPEYTGVVAGMSGSPVYIGDKLLGSISYRIGQFAKDPIAGITPIEQMLEVRNMPISPVESAPPAQLAVALSASSGKESPFVSSTTTFQPIETPLVMSGFQPEAVRLWQQKLAGTGLDVVAAGGSGPSPSTGNDFSPTAAATIVPGSAVSAELVRGDLVLAATCTVTYVDPKQLLACGHPILQAGPVSLPMTTTDVLATLASPFDSFKIINTGEPIGAFTQDRDSAIRGVFGARARMIPMHIHVHGMDKPRTLNLEVLDLPSITPQAVLICLYQALLQSNDTTADTSFHVTGNVDIVGYPHAPIDLWAQGGEGLPSPLVAALQTGDRFTRFYSNEARQGEIRAVDLDVEAVPRRVSVELESARIVSGDIVHAGDTVTVEATLRPWRQRERNVRIPFAIPARLQAGSIRILVSDGPTLDRTLDQPRMAPRPADMNSTVAQASRQHSAEQLYVSLLVPETQAGLEGRTLTGVPISVANALEPLRSGQDVSLNGESAVLAVGVPADGVLNGFQVLNLRIEPGGGVN